MSLKIIIPSPELQIDFSNRLQEIKNNFLQPALKEAIEQIDIQELDHELAIFAPKDGLNLLARIGIRGEQVFAIPSILTKNPQLLGYYRLLLGLSQKEFYSNGTGLSKFKLLESKGKLTTSAQHALPLLCKEMNGCAQQLILGIESQNLNLAHFNELTLLTLGPQLRGSANVRKGEEGIVEVFNAIHKIVINSIIKSSRRKIKITNAAGRYVSIGFSNDPDIVICEEIGNNRVRNIIAIEVKGGTDFSNIHNRVGEAEKSHQKARHAGYVECWTVVNVDRIDMEMAKKESPTTNKFFRLSDLKSGKGDFYQEFEDCIVSLTGIRNKGDLLP